MLIAKGALACICRHFSKFSLRENLPFHSPVKNTHMLFTSNSNHHLLTRAFLAKNKLVTGQLQIPEIRGSHKRHIGSHGSIKHVEQCKEAAGLKQGEAV